MAESENPIYKEMEANLLADIQNGSDLNQNLIFDLINHYYNYNLGAFEKVLETIDSNPIFHNQVGDIFLAYTPVENIEMMDLLLKKGIDPQPKLNFVVHGSFSTTPTEDELRAIDFLVKNGAMLKENLLHRLKDKGVESELLNTWLRQMNWNNRKDAVIFHEEIATNPDADWEINPGQKYLANEWAFRETQTLLGGKKTKKNRKGKHGKSKNKRKCRSKSKKLRR